MNAMPASGLILTFLFASSVGAGGADGAPAGDAGKVWREKAVQFILEIEDEDLRSDVSYEAVYVLVRAGELEQAREAAERVTTPQTRIYAFTQVAKGYRDADNAAAALAVLDACRKSLLDAYAEQRRDWIDYMVRAYAEAGFIEAAQGLAGEMKQKSQRENVLQDITRIVAEAGELDRALSLVNALGTPERQQAGLARMVASLASSQ